MSALRHDHGAWVLGCMASEACRSEFGALGRYGSMGSGSGWCFGFSSVQGIIIQCKRFSGTE